MARTPGRTAMKLDRPAIALLGVSTLTSIAFVVFGAISLMGSLAKNDNQPSSERLNFTLGPGEVRRVKHRVSIGNTGTDHYLPAALQQARPVTKFRGADQVDPAFYDPAP